MKSKLTLQEKLRDLREERKLKLSELSEATGIPNATLQRLENSDDIRTGYQDIATLAMFYNVSTDYLFDVTDNRQHRNIEVDKLSLSDEAIFALSSKKLNNRLICELISHKNFPRLLASMEIYVDRKISPQISAVNSTYKLAKKLLKDNVEISDNDDVMVFLKNSIVDDEEYLRYRITHHFNNVIKSLYDEHKKDTQTMESENVLNEMSENIQMFLDSKSPKDHKHFEFWCKQVGLETSGLTLAECEAVNSAIMKFRKFKQVARWRK